MFTKALAIIDCISTLISHRPEYYDRFNGIILRIIYLLPGYGIAFSVHKLWIFCFSLCKMNVIPSHVLIEALKMMKHAQSMNHFSLIRFINLISFLLDLTNLFLDSDLFPSFVDKNLIVSQELDPTAR